MDAALKLGDDGPFRNVPPQFSYWLGTRAKPRLSHKTIDLAERVERARPRILTGPPPRTP